MSEYERMEKQRHSLSYVSIKDSFNKNELWFFEGMQRWTKKRKSKGTNQEARPCVFIYQLYRVQQYNSRQRKTQKRGLYSLLNGTKIKLTVEYLDTVLASGYARGPAGMWAHGSFQRRN